MPQNKNITRTKNPHIKNIIQLRERKGRQKTGLMIVEGFREVLRAKEGSVTFREVYLCRDFFRYDGMEKLLEDIASLGIKPFETTKEVFSKISFGQRQEGILAVCQQPQWTLRDLKLKKNPLLVIMEGVEKPGNLGAVLRTCDGAGVDGLILCDAKTDRYNPNVVRASIGTVFCIPTIESSQEKTLAYLRKNQIKICAASPQAKTLYAQADLSVSLAIVIGSEERGLKDFWMENSDIQVKIPMRGKADSLNLSTTTAILVYEAIRQRTR